MSFINVWKRTLVDLPPFKPLLTLFCQEQKEVPQNIRTLLDDAQLSAAEDRPFIFYNASKTVSYNKVKLNAFDLEIERNKPTKIQTDIIIGALQKTGLSEKDCMAMMANGDPILIDWMNNNACLGTDAESIFSLLKNIK